MVFILSCWAGSRFHPRTFHAPILRTSAGELPPKNFRSQLVYQGHFQQVATCAIVGGCVGYIEENTHYVLGLGVGMGETHIYIEGGGSFA